MDRETKSRLAIASVVIISILLVIYGGIYLFSLFQPKPQFLTQYHNILKCGSYAWMYGHDYPISISPEAEILDYKIVTESFSDENIVEFVSCKENTCNGDFKEKDEYGCDVWRGITGKLGCGSDHAYQCSCNTAPETKQCGDRTVECRYSPCGCPMIMQDFTCYGTCGGANVNVIKQGGGCYSKDKVYYKNNLVYETPLLYKRNVVSFREGVNISGNQEADLSIAFQNDYQYYGSSGRDTSCPEYKPNGLYISKGCYGMINDYIFKTPDNAFNFSVEIPKQKVVKKEELKAKVIINNDWSDVHGVLNVNLLAYFESFNGMNELSSTLKREININTGKNIYEFNIPTDFIVDNIYITPSVDVLIEGNKFSGVNYYCYDQPNTKERDVSTCSYLSLGRYDGDVFNINIETGNTSRILNCNDVGCNKGECDKESGLCVETVEKIPAWVLWLIGILVFIIIVRWIKNGNKR